MTDAQNPCPECKGVFWAEVPNSGNKRCRRCGFIRTPTPAAPVELQYGVPKKAVGGPVVTHTDQVVDANNMIPPAPQGAPCSAPSSVAALLAYSPADMHGTMVEASRQAIHEVVDALATSDARIAELEAALKPFADCADQIDPHEDGGEWAKFRLLVDDYRAAVRALKTEQGDG